MQRITTNVDPDVYTRLEDLARRRHTSTARVIREALARYVTDEEAAQEPEPLPDWVGMLDGPGGAWAERDEEVLRAEWPAALDPHRHEG
ncbi:MAG: ribbon-helix-helix protein, CopG family [Chloroflexi bacterium]|nr:ribbon-helix-helix protein, CopG family [Chloroflexota bacterium]